MLYLIGAGVPKAGTTSIFFYLKDHPEVCTTIVKEARFFLDKDYPLLSKYRFEDGFDKYEKYFMHCSGENKKIRVDITPDYIYSFNTPYKIKSVLERPKLFFILRDPITRLISVYRFNLQNGIIPKSLNFDKYVKLCQNIGKKEAYPQKREELPFYALIQGNYSKYLVKYFEIFSNEDILILFYEEFFENPREYMKKLSIFAGIDPNFYETYNFRKYNVTKKTRFSLLHKYYLRTKNFLRIHIHNSLFRFLLKKISRPFDFIYEKFNFVDSNNTVFVSNSILSFLKEYYKEEKTKLKALIKREIPWEF